MSISRVVLPLTDVLGVVGSIKMEDENQPKGKSRTENEGSV